MFESIPDYKKVVLLMFLKQNDKNLLLEIGFSERDIDRSVLECKSILLEQHESFLVYVNDQEVSILGKFLYKKMEANFNNIFEDIRYEKSLVLLLSLVEPDFLKQSKITDHEIDSIKNIAPEKLHRKRNLKEIVALDLLKKQFSNY